MSQLILDLARSQYGVASRVQLLGLGISSGAVWARLQNGFLASVFSGVYGTGVGVLQQRGVWMAATLTGPSGSVLSHYSAATLHGMARAKSYVDVTRPDSRTAGQRDRRPAGPSSGWELKIHRSRDLPDREIVVVDGIRVTSPARTLLDLAATEKIEDLQSSAIAGEHQRAWSQRDLEHCAARGKGWTGIRNFREVTLGFGPEDLQAESHLEIEFRQFCRDHDIELPTLNVPKGEHRVDAIWEDRKLIVEVDSWEHHRSREQFEADRRRDNLNLARGYATCRITSRAMKDRPEETAALLKRAHAVGGAGAMWTPEAA